MQLRSGYFLILVSLVFFSSHPAHANPMFSALSHRVPVYDNIGSSAGAGGTLTVGFTTTKQKELLLLAVAYKNTTAMGATVPTTAGLTWEYVGGVSNVHRMEIYRAVAVNPGNYTVFITIPGGAKGAAMLGWFYNANMVGANGSSAFDISAGATGNSTMPTASVAPSTPRSLIIGFFATGNGNGGSLTAGFSKGYNIFTAGGGPTSNVSLGMVIKDKIVPANTPVPVPISLGGAVDWTEFAVAIKP